MLNRVLTTICATAMALATVQPCLARIGEAEAEIEARYGMPARTEPKPIDAAPAEKRVWFEKNGVLVGAIIYRGRCVGESYGFMGNGGETVKVGDDLPKAKALLQANAQGAVWKEHLPELVNPGMEYLWQRSDGKAFAVVWKRSPDTLQVMEASFVNESANSDKQSAAGLEGF